MISHASSSPYRPDASRRAVSTVMPIPEAVRLLAFAVLVHTPILSHEEEMTHGPYRRRLR